MKRTAHLLVFTILCIVTSYSCAQEQSSAPLNEPGPGPVNIEISLNHDATSTEGELILTVRMTNISEEEHCYKMMRGDVRLSFDVEVLKSNGDKVGPLPEKESYSTRTSSGKTQCLQAGATLTKTMRLDQKFDLVTPGTYRVQVSRFLSGRSGNKVFSNPLTFTISPKDKE